MSEIDLMAPSILFLFALAGALLAWLASILIFRRENSPQSTPQELQQTLDNAPLIIWTEKNNKVVWSNAPCQTRFEQISQLGITAFDPLPKSPRNKGLKRMRIQTPGQNDPVEFVVEHVSLDNKSIYYASDAKPLIETEQELQRFIQTLTGTFAHLPIGLTIFDKKRDLSLFNPALSDLLNLPAEWLIRRPSLMSFLDRLRSEGIMPEPDDFNSLRQEFQNLESGAVEGTYQAEWTLANGRIYRVVGRPHIQGGLALLFEDISKSVMVERQYRAELEQLYSAFDSLADGVAIFDPSGELVFVNDAFDDLWCSDMAGALAPINVIDFTRALQERCAPTPAWGDFREFVLEPAERSQWQAPFILNTGETVLGTFSPIAGGQVFCEFRIIHNHEQNTINAATSPQSQIPS